MEEVTHLKESSAEETDLKESSAEETDLKESSAEETDLKESSAEETDLKESSAEKTDLKESSAEKTYLKESAEEQFDEGNFDNALSNFKKLLKEQIRELGRTHEDTLHTQSRIASVLEEQMKYSEAVRTLIKLYRTKLRSFGILNDSTAETRCCVVELLKKYYTYLLTPEMCSHVMSTLQLELRIVKKFYLRGKYEEALNSALAIRKNTEPFLNKNNPIIERIAIIIGKIYIAKEEHYKAILEIHKLQLKMEKLYGQHDRRIATCLMMKASAFHKLCEFEEALKLYLNAHTIRKDILGLTHKKTLLSLLSIARLYSDIGNYDQALEIMQVVLEKQELNHDIESLQTSISIGLLYIQKSQYEEALETFRQTTHVEYASKRTKAKIQNNIANLLMRLGRYSDARCVLMKVIKRRKSSNYHADTLSTYRDMALVLAKEGLITSAHALLNVLIEASGSILGIQHSLTFSIQNDQALLYLAQSLYNEAFNTLKYIWDERIKVLGEFHPDTLYSKFQTATVYRSRGETETALEMYTEVWDLQKAIFYPQHNDRLTVEAEIAETYLSLDCCTLAFEIIYGIYEAKIQMYGRDHPYIREIEDDVRRFGRGLNLRRIIVATLYENLNDVKKFIEEGDDVNARDVNGSVALHYASREGYIDILKYLLSKGAIYHIEDQFENTPEKFAEDRATKEVFMLVKSLFANVKSNNYGEVRRILGQENSIVNARDENRRTPLHYAVERRHREIIRELIQHGADPVLSNTEDGTVLIMATKHNDFEVLNMLLRHVKLTNPEKLQEFVDNKKNCMGLSPLHFAIMQNSYVCIDVLIQYNVNPTVHDLYGRTIFEFVQDLRVTSNLALYLVKYIHINNPTASFFGTEL